MYRKTNYIANPSFRLKRGVWENSIRLRTFILLIGLFIVRTGYSLDTRSDSIDIKNIKLDLSFANFSAKTLYGKTTLSIESKLQNVVGIDLDLLKLTVDSVLFNNQQISFSYNDSVIGIRFPQSLIFIKMLRYKYATTAHLIKILPILEASIGMQRMRLTLV